jgi:dienelactone hydrolase
VRIRRVLVALGAAAALGLAVLLVALLYERHTQLTLPAPGGPYAVGRVIEVWSDAARDLLAPAAEAHRELLVWVWYPAAAGSSSGATAQYLPAAMRDAVGRSRGGLLTFLTHDLSRVRTESLPDAAVSPREARYPVLILRAGGSAEVWNYSVLAQDLASHGYVVVGFDAPYRTNVVAFPDGRVLRRTPRNNPELCIGAAPAAKEQCLLPVLRAWTADMAFALDRLQQLNGAGAHGRFAGRLDLGRVGVLGHSFGGAAALQFCQEDPRCRAAIDLDGALHGPVVAAGLQRPVMFLMSDHRREFDAEATRIWSAIDGIYRRLPPAERERLMIRGGNHFFFSDDAALLKSRVVLGALRLAGIVRIDGARQLQIAAYGAVSFFDAHLQGAGAPLPDAPRYPELEALR